MTETRGRAGKREKDESRQRLERIQLEKERQLIRRERERQVQNGSQIPGLRHEEDTAERGEGRGHVPRKQMGQEEPGNGTRTREDRKVWVGRIWRRNEWSVTYMHWGFFFL